MMSGMDFDDRVVLVTGAGSGIGAATAELFAARGAAVIVADLIGDRADEVAGGITASGGRAVGIACDVGTTAGWAGLADLVNSRFGRIDVVHNNAFTQDVRPAHETTVESWERQLAVNLTAVYHSVRAFIPGLQRTGGCIVNTSSVHAVLGFPHHPAYAASKGGIVALTRQLAVDYGPEVRVNAVLPGGVMSRAWDGATSDDVAATVRRTTAGRLGRPQEVAAAVGFLASDQASYITGTTLLVDGGMSALGVN